LFDSQNSADEGRPISFVNANCRVGLHGPGLESSYSFRQGAKKKKRRRTKNAERGEDEEGGRRMKRGRGGEGGGGMGEK
jgi:hypothetical protein